MAEKAKAVSVSLSLPVDVAAELDGEAKQRGQEFSVYVLGLIQKARGVK